MPHVSQEQAGLLRADRNVLLVERRAFFAPSQHSQLENLRLASTTKLQTDCAIDPSTTPVPQRVSAPTWRLGAVARASVLYSFLSTVALCWHLAAGSWSNHPQQLYDSQQCALLKCDCR
jgi:hypothetical protein